MMLLKEKVLTGAWSRGGLPLAGVRGGPMGAANLLLPLLLLLKGWTLGTPAPTVLCRVGAGEGRGKPPVNRDCPRAKPILPLTELKETCAAPCEAAARTSSSRHCRRRRSRQGAWVAMG